MDDLGIWGIGILVLWLVLSNLLGGGKTKSKENKYPIERRQSTDLVQVERRQESGTWSQITARNAAQDNALRAKKSRSVLLRGKYPGLLEEPPVEVVNGEVVDDTPQLNARNPQRERLLPQSDRSKKLLGGR
jgi:hypothetical protein